MELNWPWILGLGGLLIAVSLLAWAVRSGRRGPIVGAVVGILVGGVAGYLILVGSNQSGISSINGFIYGAVLVLIAAGLVIYGMLNRPRRTAALVTAGTMVATAVAVAQLIVALGLQQARGL